MELVEDAAATYRLTRLITTDALTQGVRDRIVEAERERVLSTGDELTLRRRYGADVASEGGPLSYLVQCPWCCSVYVAVGVAVARRLLPLPWGLAARALAMSAVTGMVADRS